MRTSGILLHISSLPSPYGIGTFGADAYRFVDFLKRAGQSCWQILPLGCTGYGDSPYQSFSTFAGNPYFIDLDTLRGEGLLFDADYSELNWGADVRRVDYGALYSQRLSVLRRAFSRFDTSGAEYTGFCARHAGWLEDFALFMSVKRSENGASCLQWPQALRMRDIGALDAFRAENTADIEFWRFTQFQFFKQWYRLKTYANQNGIRIVGDLPIYVAEDSADIWANPSLFALDENLIPALVAGVPPDFFSADGQLWGNPVYNWPEMRRQSYAWWIARMRMACTVYDVVRLDHFRGFDQYYVLPFDAAGAAGGRWLNGPGIELFEALEKELGALPIIAENLGIATPGVRHLLKQSGYPGMRVLHFGFSGDSENENLPHNIGPHNVVYAGTHDNDTTGGWLKSLAEHEKAYCLDYLRRDNTDDFVWQFLKLALSTSAELAVLTMQDCLLLGGEARMNKPSTTEGNWRWRIAPGELTDALADRLAHITRLYGRYPA